MRILFAWALGLGLCAGLVFAAEPGSKKPQGAPRAKVKPAEEDDLETAGKTGAEPESDDAASDDNSNEADEKPSHGKKAAPRGAGAKDLEIRKKASYMIAVEKMRELKRMGVEIVLDDFIQGVKDELAENARQFSEDERKETWLAMEQLMLENQAKMDRATGAKFKKEGEAFLAENKSKEGFKTTKSGLQYKVLKSGKGKSPKPNDTIAAHYKGTFTNGKLFESTYQQGRPVSMPLNRALPGWIEALQLMKVGDKWRIVIPSKLAYGAEGMKDPRTGQHKIPPNATLIFDVELLSVTGAGDE